MMTARRLIEIARERGLRLRPKPDGTIGVSPAGRIDSDLRGALKAMKEDVLAYLRERHCAGCGEPHPVMVLMEPGADGSAWRLCSTCYRGRPATAEEWEQTRADHAARRREQ